MLTEKQIKEIVSHLERSQNPLFLFDNDTDGLVSFLLLRRFIGRGKGVAIKSYPELNVSYFKRIKELNPDYIFILDKPEVSQEFFKKVRQNSLPIVWIDHHQVKKSKIKELKNLGVNYYNPFLNNKTSEPTSYLCYKIINKKDDLWLALIGCISDAFIPDFYNEFQKQFPELAKKNPLSAFDILYKSEIGKIARILDFSLKDTTTNVVNMLKFMGNVKSPYDILEENYQTKQILKKYNEINSKYLELIKKAKEQVKDKIIFFQYGGELSLSYNIANELMFEFPDRIVVVVYVKDDIANISLRGKNVRKLTLSAIKNIPNATGGGHKDATGAKISSSYLSQFKDKIEELVNKK
ncbi:MAG: DHHA1 domain-containing protein [Nanoarchaeota archaeon]